MGARFWTGLGGALALSALLVAPAAAQGGPGGAGPRAADGGFGGFGGRFGGPPPAVSPEAERAAEIVREINLVRLMAQYKVPRATLEQIRDLIAQAFATLAAGDAVAAKELSESQPLLVEARRLVLSGENLTSPTTQETTVAGTLNRLGGQRDGFLRQLAQQVQQLLAALPPEERDPLLLVGQALVRQFRAEQTLGVGPVGPGGAGGGRVARDLDRLRNATPQNWENERMRFALQNAGIPGWWNIPGMIPGRGGPGGGRGGPGGGRGGRGGRGFQGGRPDGGFLQFQAGGPGGGRGGRGNQQAPNLSDPAIQAKLKPFLQMADQARSMSPQAYQQAREKMALQVEQQRQLERVNAPIRDEEALMFLGRALASEVGLAALEAKVGKATLPPAGGD
jgi:hypothetical protein